jgi:hypothetical protein
MIQFLYQGGHGSHGPRTQALASITAGSRCGDINETEPSAIAGLDTLTFWGHGDSNKLCDKTPSELRTIIAAWRKLNKSISTIEIITCNARHCTAGTGYASQLKAKFGIMSGTSGLTVKALPVTVTGKINAWSILLWEPNFDSWCYVTAPGKDDTLLMKATTLVQYEIKPDGGMICFKGDMAKRADQVVRDHPDRKWTMNYGYLNTLRYQLGTVR